jgi:hypothetical protein
VSWGRFVDWRKEGRERGSEGNSRGLTRTKLEAMIKGTKVMWMATLVGLLWYAPYCG